MWLKSLSNFSRADLAMDLGTANSLVYSKGEGIVLNEPSVVALSKTTRQVLAIGSPAKAMFGKTPDDIEVVRPMKDGVIADFDSTRKMVSHFIKSVRKGRFMRKPKIIICVPSGITQVEKKAVIDSALAAGVRQAILVDEPMAAAIGTKMPVGESCGNLIVDIGGGTTEVAIISVYANAYTESVRVAGDEMDEAMVRYIRQNYNLDIGLLEAERIKMEIGSAYPLQNQVETVVSGRDIKNWMPKTVTFTDEDVRDAIEEPVRAICEAVRKALENTTPELVTDISQRGIVLAGGGAMIKGLGTRLNKFLNVPVYRAKDPLTAVVRGAGMIMEDWETYKRVAIN